MQAGKGFDWLEMLATCRCRCCLANCPPRPPADLQSPSHCPPPLPCSIVMVLGSLLVQLYFGGSLPRSPFPNQQQRQRSGRSVVPAPTLPAATQ